jgi:hypothetical protein
MGTPLDHGIADPTATAAAMIKASPSIAATTSRTMFLAEASNYRDSEPVMAAAVESEGDAKVFATAGGVTARLLALSRRRPRGRRRREPREGARP